MNKQRDKLGRFIRGNTIAKGNKGNTKPKYNNQNALKHGLFANIPAIKTLEDGSLYISNGIESFSIKEAGFYIDDNKIWFRNDVATVLEKAGFRLLE